MKRLKRRVLQGFCISLAVLMFFSTPMHILAAEQLPKPYEGRNEYKPEEMTPLTEEEMAALVNSLQEEYEVETVEPIETEPQEAPMLFSMFSLRAAGEDSEQEETDKNTADKTVDTNFHIYPQVEKSVRKYNITSLTVGGCAENPTELENIEYWIDGTEEKYTVVPVETPLENGDNWTGVSPFTDLETGKLYQFAFEYHGKAVEEEKKEEGEETDTITTSENTVSGNTTNTVSQNTVSENTISLVAEAPEKEETDSNIRYSEPFYLYEVQCGDKLKNIADAFGVSYKTLIADNQIAGRQPLAGSVLFLRSPDIGETEDAISVFTDEMLAKLPMQGSILEPSMPTK